MSRRIKLLITALFFVLLLVPAVYVALTWTVESPFRFRYVGQGAPEKFLNDPVPVGSTQILMVPLQLEVENTSSVRIDFKAILFSKAAGQEPQMAALLSGIDTLPAHSVIRTEAYISPELARSLADKELRMHCKWITTPKRRVQKNLTRVVRWLDFLFEHKMSLPTWQRDDYPVEDATTSSPAPAPSSSTRSP
jgi:hypothetical protein